MKDDKFLQPKPIKVGEEHEVEISDISSRGDGIARIENFVIFVAGTQKGDRVKIRIKDVSSRYAIGEKLEDVSGDEGSSEAPGEEEAAADEASETSDEEESEEASEDEEASEAESEESDEGSEDEDAEASGEEASDDEEASEEKKEA